MEYTHRKGHVSFFILSKLSLPMHKQINAETTSLFISKTPLLPFFLSIFPSYTHYNNYNYNYHTKSRTF